MGKSPTRGNSSKIINFTHENNNNIIRQNWFQYACILTNTTLPTSDEILPKHQQVHLTRRKSWFSSLFQTTKEPTESIPTRKPRIVQIFPATERSSAQTLLRFLYSASGVLPFTVHKPARERFLFRLIDSSKSPQIPLYACCTTKLVTDTPYEAQYFCIVSSLPLVQWFFPFLDSIEVDKDPDVSKLNQQFQIYMMNHQIILREISMDSHLAQWSWPMLFGSMSFDIICHLLASMILEYRIILFSSQRLTVAACVLGAELLLRPLKWIGTILPYVPVHLTEIFDSPIPYLCGVSDYNVPEPQHFGSVLINVDTNTMHILEADRKKVTLLGAYLNWKFLPPIRSDAMEQFQEQWYGQMQKILSQIEKYNPEVEPHHRLYQQLRASQMFHTHQISSDSY